MRPDAPELRQYFRRLGLEDMDAAARVHRVSFDHRLPMLAGLHTPQEDSAYFREHVMSSCEIWGSFAGTLTGIIAFRDGWIDHLYVRPDCQRQGIGAGLLEIAQARFDCLSLWTFQRNAVARRFYEKHGFLAIEQTDGSSNELNDPDILYRWRRGT